MLVTGMGSGIYRLPMTSPWGPSQTCQYLIAATLETQEGVVGQGFSWTPQVGASAIRAMFEKDCRPFVLGGPAAPGPLWDRLWWHLREAGAGGVTSLAIAAVDTGLWDLRAKAAGLSLVDLIGRRHAEVPAYASGVNRHLPLDELTDQVRRWVAAGHSRFKIKVGLPGLEQDLERVAAVRTIIGPRRALMVDANQLWDYPAALRAARALSAYDIFWLEEPLPADDIAAYQRLRARIDIPVATGESLASQAQFRDLLVAGGCDYLQPNVCRVGGITPFLRIAALAASFGVPVMPHLLPDIAGQLALCLPGPTLVEDIDEASFASLGALARPSGVTIAGGVLRADTAAGHGLLFATDQLEEITE
ncbi:MAG TPA: mandelate racemase/muconate lactonizing enzyme family protein [Streptosporangiaceae bacterium]|jgi:L-alanine-DL-glutamate epimerase-like enolase superfamily enzyme